MGKCKHCNNEKLDGYRFCKECLLIYKKLSKSDRLKFEGVQA